MCPINGQPRLSWILCSLLLVLLLAACRREDAGGPLVQATLTPTPRSTPLPPVPTTIPPGIEENPIQMVLRPAGNIAVSRRSITDAQIEAVQAAILESSGLVVQVTLVDRYAEALAALCDSTPLRVTVAWLDGLTYQAAMAQDCGVPVIQVERDGQTGDVGHIVGGAGFSSVSALNGGSFCRLSPGDYYSWLVPSLLLEAAGLSPISGLETISDYEDTDALMEAVAAGDCDAAGISESEWDDLGSAADDLNLMASTTPLPYGVLMYPMNLTLGERLRLSDALLALDEAVLKPFFNQDGLVSAEVEDFEDLSDFLDRTGLDFVQLGQ